MRAYFNLLRVKSVRVLLFLIPLFWVLSHVAVTKAQVAADGSALTPAQLEFFEKSIRPVLANSCYECHSAQGRSAGQLQLDSREAILAGGRSGPAMIPGDAEGSMLVQRVLLVDPEHRMPKGEAPLSPEIISNLKTWIQQGAFWPKDQRVDEKPSSVVKQSDSDVARKLPNAAEIGYFKDSVRPIFVDHCYSCHSAAFKPAGGLRLDTREGFFSGGNSGPTVVPGNPDASMLIKKVLLTDEKHRMPLESAPLGSDEIAILTKWVKDGAA